MFKYVCEVLPIYLNNKRNLYFFFYLDVGCLVERNVIKQNRIYIYVYSPIYGLHELAVVKVFIVSVWLVTKI